MKNRFISAAMAGVLALSLTACGQSGGTPNIFTSGASKPSNAAAVYSASSSASVNSSVPTGSNESSPQSVQSKPDYSDVSAAQSEPDEPDVSGQEESDLVQFGAYEQDNVTSNGAEPLVWKVLEEKDGKLFLLSKYIIDAASYNDREGEITWEKCTMRARLNGEFYDTAFTDEEKNAIALTHNVNHDHEKGTPGGKDTDDHVFLLSTEEFEKYFPDMLSTRAGVTALAEYHGEFAHDDYLTENYEASGWWWLRSPGDGPTRAAIVKAKGELFGLRDLPNHGYDVEVEGEGVRPAMWVDKAAVKFLEGGSAPAQSGPSVTHYAPEKGVKIDDIIIFGSYEQDNNPSNGAEPIEWIVLDVVLDEKALIVSKYALDSMPFHEAGGSVTWDNCSLREWLNNDFVYSAFSNDDRVLVLDTKIDNSNPNDGFDYAPAGSDTSDRVFLLSLQESLRYFTKSNPSNMKRRTSATPYAVAQGINQSSSVKTEDGKPAVWWWTRTRCNLENSAQDISAGGMREVGSLGKPTDYKDGGVRPAMWVKLPYR